MKQFLFFILFLLSIGLVTAACTTTSCTNIGQIQNNKYCSIDGVWCPQLLNGMSCDNNFECLSGNCIEETCSSTSAKQEYETQKSLLEQILDFLSGQQPITCTTGARQNNQYCKDNTWIDQKPTDTTCTNSYECVTNNCDSTTSKCKECTSPNDCSSGICSNNICVTSTTTGGGGTTGGGTGDLNVVEHTFSTVKSDKLYSFTIDERPIPVTKIGFISKNALSNVYFKVKYMSSRDSNIPEPKGLLYSYFQLTTKNIQDTDLEKAEIQFRVTKEWLTQNNVNPYNIILQRYTTTWTQITPQIIKDDTKYYYYSALTPGFSWFAITSFPCTPNCVGKECGNDGCSGSCGTCYSGKICTSGICVSAPAPIVAPEQPECGDGIIDLNENCDTCPEDATCLATEKCSLGVCIPAKKISILWFIIPPIVVILTVLVIFLLKKYKKPEKPTSFIRPASTVKYYRR